MSDAINRAKAEADRNGDPQAFEAMLIELAETVQRLAMWEVKYVAVKDRRHMSVPITVDPKVLADEIRRQLALEELATAHAERDTVQRELDRVVGTVGNLQRDLAATRHALNDSNDDRGRLRAALAAGRGAIDRAHKAVREALNQGENQ